MGVVTKLVPGGIVDYFFIPPDVLKELKEQIERHGPELEKLLRETKGIPIGLPSLGERCRSTLRGN